MPTNLYSNETARGAESGARQKAKLKLCFLGELNQADPDVADSYYNLP